MAARVTHIAPIVTRHTRLWSAGSVTGKVSTLTYQPRDRLTDIEMRSGLPFLNISGLWINYLGASGVVEHLHLN